MLETTWLLALAIGGVSFATVIAALLALRALRALATLRRGSREGDTATLAECVFLFERERLIDCTSAGHKLIAAGPEGLSDWDRLCAALAPRFGDVRGRLDGLAAAGHLTIESLSAPRAVLEATWRDGAARVAVAEGGRTSGEIRLEAPVHHAIFSELASLRRIAAELPTPAWTLDAAGEIAWANRAYVALVQRCRGRATPPAWPLPRLFADRDGATADRLRVPLDVAGQTAPLWFELSSLGDATPRVAFAVPADDTVKAETALGAFRQTLTKTFAHLSIGVAIFDRARHLVMFNPALTDLTRLGPDFLSAQPPLSAFLDRLREKQMMPEPRDYKSWRQKLTELEEAAGRGTFEETWSIPSGQTYRVSGLPQPDGALAFLFEDISAEIAMTRRYRQELEIGQAVIDTVPEAIAVFSPAGVLTLSNRAYAELWGSDPGSTLGEIGIAEATRLWRGQCRSAAILDELEDFAGHVGVRTGLSGEATTGEGTRLAVRGVALTGGATLIGFSPVDEARLGHSVAAAPTWGVVRVE